MPLPTQKQGLFVTGTDTGVGKTWLTVMIVRQLLQAGVNVGTYKPVCSGSQVVEEGEQWEDVEALYAATEGRFPRQRIAPQCFTAPLAPPDAARSQGATVDERLIRSGFDWWQQQVQCVLVEGAGGLLCPLTDVHTMADLASWLELPLLIVARVGLGTINHTLLTVEVAERRGLKVAGIVLNRSTLADDVSLLARNWRQIASRTNVPVLGYVDYQGQQLVLESGIVTQVDWLQAIEVGVDSPTTQ